MIRSYKDLEVYKKAFGVAKEIFWISRKFPKEEMYSLISQINSSARSISANITEGWAKRSYEAVFRQHLVHALGSAAETENWLLFALEFKYIEQEEFNRVVGELDEIGKMLQTLIQKWKNYTK
jgi:four helix bundle protein